MDTQTEIVIVGAGIAGISTALELLDHGKKVVILDRDKEENFGGLAKESFGGMFFVDSPIQRKAGMKDSPELALSDWMATADFGDGDDVPKAWARQYVYHCTEHVFHWLRHHKVGFFPVVHWVERGLYKPGNSYPRFHMVWGTGHELATVLIKDLVKHPNAKECLSLHFRCKVEELLDEAGAIVGVRGVEEESGKAFEIRSEVTVVATGGIGGNIQKLKDNWYQPWGEPPQDILVGAHEYGIGDIHEEVERKNGRVTHLDWQWNYAAGVHHPRPKKPNHGLSLIPPKSALWLNYRGERIGPMPLVSSYDTRFLVEQICRQEKKYSWQVLNFKIANKEFAISGSEFNKAMRDKSYVGFLKTILLGNKELVRDMLDNCVDFVVADNIGDLVKKMNDLAGTEDVQLEAVTEAIQKYDAHIDRGPDYFDDEQLRRIAHARRYRGDRVRTCKFQKINDPSARPLIAIREFIVSRKTLGGIQTDLQSRVLDQQGTPIPGLYATGEAAGFGGGGLHGKGALEGTFLGACVLTARVAAYDIIGKKLIN